jgi:hypothetical protein
MDYADCNYYVSEGLKFKKREKRELTTLLYNAVLWNRVEPKYIPDLSDVLGDEEPTEKTVQTIEEQEDILRSMAGRGKRNGKV